MLSLGTSNDPKRVDAHFTGTSSQGHSAFCRNQSTKSVKRHGLSLRRQSIFVLNPCIDFFPMNRDRAGGFDSETDLPAFQTKHDHADVGTDREAFSAPSCKYQHTSLPWHEV